MALPRGAMRFVIVVVPDHTHLLFSIKCMLSKTHITIANHIRIITYTKKLNIRGLQYAHYATTRLEKR